MYYLEIRYLTSTKNQFVQQLFRLFIVERSLYHCSSFLEFKKPYGVGQTPLKRGVNIILDYFGCQYYSPTVFTVKILINIYTML